MLAQVQTYIFSAASKTVTFSRPDYISIDQVKAIIHKPTGSRLYITGTPTLAYQSWNNSTKTITLNASVSTSGMSDGDPLEIIYEMNAVTENGAVNVGNAVKKFRDGFASLAQNEGFDSSIWTTTFSNQGTTSVGRRGNAAGSAYMNISMCPFTINSEVVVESIQTFKYPMRFMAGTSFHKELSVKSLSFQ